MPATTPRYEVIPCRYWENAHTKQKVSLYGAVPYHSNAEAEGWSVVTKGFTIRDNVRSTVGVCRPPFETREDAETFVMTLEARFKRVAS